jgi:hypothetical protein
MGDVNILDSSFSLNGVDIIGIDYIYIFLFLFLFLFFLR